MRIAFTNLRLNPQSLDVIDAEGENIRLLIEPRETVVAFNVDPWYLNQDELLRATVAAGELAVTFVPDVDDLVALGVGVAHNGVPLGAFRTINFIGGAVAPSGDTANVTLGGGGGGSALLAFQAERVGATTTTRFLGAPAIDQALIEPRVYVAPFDGVLSRLRVAQSSPAGNGNTIVYTVRVNGTPSALVAALASTDLVGLNLVNAVAVTAGDQVDLMVTKALAVGVSPRGVLAEVELS